MKCHSCAHDNVDNALFCAGCRRPLLAPTRTPTRLEPLAATAGSSGGSFGAADDRTSRNRFAPPENARGDHVDDGSDLLTEDEAWAAVIGDTNTHYYLERFERLSGGGSAAWHWPAFLVTFYWMLYRKMWLPALLWFFVPGMVLVAAIAAVPSAAVALYAVWGVARFVVPATMSNGWYFRQCEKKIRDVRARGGSKTQMIARLEAAGGTSGAAVVFLGVFIIIAIIGILAAVALPAYQTYTVKAKVSEAVMVGRQVTDAVDKQYEQTGAFPAGADADRIVSAAGGHSRYVTGVDIDGSTNTVTIKVEATPSVSGTLRMQSVPDGSHHLSWTCTSEGLKRYVPASCRG